MENFAAEAILHIGTFPVTNTFLNILFIDALLIGAIIFLSKRIALIPGYFQAGTELIVETFYNLANSVAPGRAKIIFPFFMSFFLYILFINWSGLLPGFGTIGFWENSTHGKIFVPIFRSATTDLNTTLALALVSLVATHIIGIKTTGIKDYISRFLPLSPMIFIGILEIVSEITKIISLSFRLFGNVFAGEVLLHTISKIFPLSAFLIPLPFLFLEILVGLVQALVFAMLTMAFMAILTTSHHAESHAKGVSN